MKSDLKPCPFCGYKENLLQRYTKRGKRYQIYAATAGQRQEERNGRRSNSSMEWPQPYGREVDYEQSE